MKAEKLQYLLNNFASGDQVDGSGALKELLEEIVNQGIAVEVTNIEAIDGSILDVLQCGSKVAKITGKQKHLYTVTYKGEGVGEGICMTYCDASSTETVSYDLTENGWVYNSTDRGAITVSSTKKASAPAEKTEK